MNIQNLIEKVTNSINSNYETFNGIIKVDQELTDEEVKNLINTIGSKKYNYPRIGIVDKKERGIQSEVDCMGVTPYVEAKIFKSISFTDSAETPKVAKRNILAIKPNCLFFRNLISEDNIGDILSVYDLGINIVAFTNLSKSQISKFAEKTMKIPKDSIYQTLNHIQFLD